MTCSAFAPLALGMRVLVFSKVADGAYRHDSISAGIAAIRQLSDANDWQVDDTTDGGRFNTKDLAHYDVVVWNNTGGTVLNEAEKKAFENFIHRGGGYVGIHSAVAGATEPGWEWYARLVGNRSREQAAQPAVTSAYLQAVSRPNPAISGLPSPWVHADVWYDWARDPGTDPATETLLFTYGEVPHQAVAWCKNFEGGRSFYTALGHSADNFNEDEFKRHLAGGIRWASADSPNLENGGIERRGLIVDLDADKGLTLEDGDRVATWKNQVHDFPAQDFVKQDEGREVPGSGRPVLRRSLPALSGHNSLSFHGSELVNMDENAFDHLITGGGYTWVVVVAPYAQISKGKGHGVSIPKLNAFFGDLKNGMSYEGFFAGFDYDNSVWAGSRNGITFGRIDANNPMASGPRLERNQYYVVAGRMGAGVGVVPLEVFVDEATPADSRPFSVNPQAKSSKLAIGQERDAINHPGGESFDGELARVLIYQRPLDDGELFDTVNALKVTYFHDPP